MKCQTKDLSLLYSLNSVRGILLHTVLSGIVVILGRVVTWPSMLTVKRLMLKSQRCEYLFSMRDVLSSVMQLTLMQAKTLLCLMGCGLCLVLGMVRRFHL